MYRKSVDLCKIGKCPAICTNKESVQLFPGEYLYFCNAIGDCDYKKHALMTIQEEPVDNSIDSN